MSQLSDQKEIAAQSCGVKASMVGARGLEPLTAIVSILKKHFNKHKVEQSKTT